MVKLSCHYAKSGVVVEFRDKNQTTLIANIMAGQPIPTTVNVGVLDAMRDSLKVRANAEAKGQDGPLRKAYRSLAAARKTYLLAVGRSIEAEVDEEADRLLVEHARNEKRLRASADKLANLAKRTARKRDAIAAECQEP